MSLLHIHTQLLEIMDWDESALEEAMGRCAQIISELSSNGSVPNIRDIKKALHEEYSEEICESLVMFLEAASKISEELAEDVGDEN